MAETNFGEKLRLLRKNSGKSQAEVAQEIAEQFSEEARISQKTLSVLEQRETTPRGAVLDILAKYYNVPLTYFFETIDRAKVDLAKEYLKNLTERSVRGSSLLARTTNFRTENDETSQDLRNYQLGQSTDDEDYFDS